jgi:hypothetical protein
MNVRAIVAVMLAGSFVLFILMSGISHMMGVPPMPEEIASRWGDLMSVLVGALVAYVAADKHLKG